MGVDYVTELAERYVHERIFPRSFKYRPPMASDRREYQFIGEARYVFLDRIFELWPEALEIPKPPQMEAAVLRYIKAKAKRDWDALTPEQQASFFDVVDAKEPPVLSISQRMAKAWQDYDRRAAWLEEKLAEEARAEG